MGWYGGAGARRVHLAEDLLCETRPTIHLDPQTGAITTDWPALLTLTVPADWVSGVFLARCVTADGFDTHALFVVRDDHRTSDLLFQQPVTTYQAYNNFPADRSRGKSLYDINSFGAPTESLHPYGTKVSFDRPYAAKGTSHFFRWETAFIRWLEREGKDVAYCTNVDVHARPDMLGRTRAFLSVGHDEYWSGPMVEHLWAARDRGVGLGFFSANSIYWRMRLEPAADGRPHRLMSCYRREGLDPHPDPGQHTRKWRELGAPEQRLIGIQSLGYVRGEYTDLVIADPEHWMFDGTDLGEGDVVPGIVGYEVDGLDPAAPGPDGTDHRMPCASPFTKLSGKETGIAHVSTYHAPSGALVFAAGTMAWPWALNRNSHLDARIARATHNVIDRLIA